MKRELLPQVFMWLFVGLLVTFVGAYVISLNENILSNIFKTGWYWAFIAAEVIIALVLGARITKMNKNVAICLYLFHTFLTGLTISSIFVAYELSSIAIIFLITSVLFAIFALIGKYTKIDLSKLWIYIIIGIIAIIVLEIINLFILNEKLDIIICIIGIIVFLADIAFDMQRIAKSADLDQISESNYPIIFAFSLYIDFINVFIDLLRLFGKRSD